MPHVQPSKHGSPRRELISRVHCRPKETVENVTVPDNPLDIAAMSREERDALKRMLIAENPEVARSLGLELVS